MISRRTLLFSGMAAFAAKPAWLQAAGDFWKDKPSAEWSAAETEKLLNRSPWSKAATVSVTGYEGMGGSGGRGARGGGGRGGSMGGGMGSTGGGGMGAGGMGGGGSMGGGGGRGGRGGNEEAIGADAARVQPRLLVRWESAAPILAATHQRLPNAATGHYLISVSGLRRTQGSDNPARAERMQGMQDRLREVTSLQTKGHDPITPAKVNRDAEGNLLFFFPKGDNPISADDKEVVFMTRVGPMEIKARFPLRDMLYQGKLEL